MARNFSFRSAIFGGLVAALVVSAVPVVASVGDAILAGKTTTAGQETHLKGNVSSQNLKITNTNSGGSAAQFIVEPGNAPFKVNTSAKVKKLNADKLDGSSSASFLKKKDYDSNKDGVVDSAVIKTRYSAGFFDFDANSPLIECTTSTVKFKADTTVVGSGGMSLAPYVASTEAIYGYVAYTSDGGATWDFISGAGLEASPGGMNMDAAVPIDAVTTLPAGTYAFGILPVGSELQAGVDYEGYCELSVMAFTGLAESADTMANPASLATADGVKIDE